MGGTGRHGVSVGGAGGHGGWGRRRWGESVGGTGRHGVRVWTGQEDMG